VRSTALTTASITTSTSFWREIVAATTRAGCYEERTCLRCFEGRVYDIERGGWLASGALALGGWCFTSTLS
jgi:hypothetical protein